MKTRCLLVTLVTVVLLGLVLFLGLFFGLRSGDAHTYRRAAVATDAGPCSVIGRYLLAVPDSPQPSQLCRDTRLLLPHGRVPCIANP